MDGRLTASLNIGFKVITVALAIFPFLAPDLPQFQDKFLGVRSGIYPPIMFAVPMIWYFRGRPSPYPHVFDTFLVLPFVLDMTANAVNLYNTVEGTDAYAHFIITLVAVLAAGMVLVEVSLPRWAVAALAIGFGTTVHTGWEIFEFALMQMGAFGLNLSYVDTVQDMTMGLVAAILGAFITVRFLWHTRFVPLWLLPRALLPEPTRTGQDHDAVA